ncbi:MAG: hypothetical protein KF872_00070 [Chitinophagales bacterium]|nr:hypothetical protein [Chitinophagales bacterium]
MKKILFLAIAASVITASCKKGFTKKQEAHFTLNGTTYNIGEDGMSANYYNGSAQYLQITPTAGSGGTMQPSILLNLNLINQTVKIDSLQEGFSYTHVGAVQYRPKRGEWKITSHEEGNPATRHTEGTFAMVVFDPANPTDSFNITDGYFYVNNY